MLGMKKYRVSIPFTSHHKIIAKKKQRGTISSVTVAISLYNYEQYIIECLESVKSQTISNLDLVIVDDCSFFICSFCDSPIKERVCRAVPKYL